MDLNKLALFRMAKSRLDWTSQRQSILAQNVANANTPGYKPSDLLPQDFQRALKQATQVPPAGQAQALMPGTLPTQSMVSPTTAMQSAMAVPGGAAMPVMTNPMHSAGTLPQQGAFRVRGDQRNYDKSIDGNAVQLEEQILKVSSSKRDYEMSMNLLRKHLTMLRTAIGKN